MYYYDAFITSDDWNEMSDDEREVYSNNVESLEASHSEHVNVAFEHHCTIFIGPDEDIPF